MAVSPPVLPLAVEVGPGQSGPVGLLVIVVLCVGCVFLFRSMSRQIKRVPRSFPLAGSTGSGSDPGGTGAARASTEGPSGAGSAGTGPRDRPVSPPEDSAGA